MSDNILDPLFRDKRAGFFNFIFGAEALIDDAKLYVCLASRVANGEHGDFEEEWFEWPAQIEAALDYIDNLLPTHNIWYAAQLFSRKRRKKENVIVCPVAWADLDACSPTLVRVEPSVVVESSPGRYQGLWRLDPYAPPLDAEGLSKRIAYYHADDGADRSGWDLTQLLRVPYTYNFKYSGALGSPIINVLSATGYRYELGDFEVYPKLVEDSYSDIPFPEEIPEANDVMMKYRHELHPLVYIHYNNPPRDDWSKALWQLENLLIESGLELSEVFAVAESAACNKYARDKRSRYNLWREVCRAYSMKAEDSHRQAPHPIFDDAKLLTDKERSAVNDKMKDNPSYIERYIKWASDLGDAAPQYHQAGAFVSLASIIAGSVRLPTSFGTIMPNLWFMILADTTLTRKTTAMDIAMDLVSEVNDAAILATDGSIEGLFAGLAVRPGTPSVFLRDEFSGLLESMVKKDYYAGMAEMLTKLYDGKAQKRVLRRETIEVREPVLIVFAGGIKNRIFELLSADQVTSGFLPRFVFITAEADLSRIRPVGPPTTAANSKRSELVTMLKELSDFYNRVEIDAGKVTKKIAKVELTPDAWARYNQFEAQMLSVGMASQHRHLLTPTFDRLAKSGLKAAVLIAASEKKADSPIVTEEHIWHAFWYVEHWMKDALEVLSNIGKSTYEKLGDAIVESVRKEPGILRGTLMKIYHLSSRQADDILTTLEQRGLIKSTRSGNSLRYDPLGEET